jgi:CRISPR-associated protein Cas2
MSRPDHLFVFCYDVGKDSARERLSSLLETSLTRVQKSVFEGRLTTAEAQRLARRAGNILGVDDSLRVYCVTEAGRRSCLTIGRTPLAERGDFWLV